MLARLTNLDKAKKFIEDDPVRPHIPAEWRISGNRNIFYLHDLPINTSEPIVIKPRAIVCVAYTDKIAITEQEMFDASNCENPNIAMFYTIWSYNSGAGRELILKVREHMLQTMPHIHRFITLSPLTTLAEKFHTRNGAVLINKGSECQNFEYPPRNDI